MAINALVEELNAAGVHDNYLSVGSYLSRNKWGHICEDAEAPIESNETRSGLAVMLENTERFIKRMDETVRAVSIGDFQKFAYPLVRAIFPELVANEIVSVQPMLGPVSLVFYMDFVYGSDKGRVKRGDTAFSAIARGPNNSSYTSPQIDEEVIGAGGANSFTGVTLSYGPVVPGSVTITDGVQIINDDTNGSFIGDVGSAAAINYATGSLSGSTTMFAATPAAGTTITATYSYDMEANPNIPQMDLVLNSSPVTARPRKLRTNWSLESAFNLRSLHGLEAEVELTASVGAEIRFEIDREIIDDLKRMAGAGSVYWNRTHSSNISFTEHKLSIIDAFQTASNLIHKVTGRGRASWIICGENVATIIETLPGFVATPGVPSGLQKGVYKAGRLNSQWDVFKDPFYPDNFFMMGFKGMSFLEAGYVYSPYIPLYSTPTVVLDDFIARKGLATQYGKKAINPLFYVTGEIGTETALAAKAGVATSALESHGSAAALLNLANGRGIFGA